MKRLHWSLACFVALLIGVGLGMVSAQSESTKQAVSQCCVDRGVFRRALIMAINESSKGEHQKARDTAIRSLQLVGEECEWHGKGASAVFECASGD